MTPLVHAHQLAYARAGKAVLRGVNVTAEAGRIIGVVGANGAGKSSLLKALLGLLPVTGELSVLGLDPRRDRVAVQTQVSHVPDVATLPGWMTLEELRTFMALVHPRFEAAAFDRWLTPSGLALTERIATLSKGMTVQVHLALALAIDAPLCVLDEPTLGLDVLYRTLFYRQLATACADSEKTVLMATHELDEIAPLLTDVWVMRDGQVVLAASLEALETRFWAVTLTPAQRERLPWVPLDETPTLGGMVALFDSIAPDALAAYGPVSRPSLRSLVAAVMRSPAFGVTP